MVCRQSLARWGIFFFIPFLNKLVWKLTILSGSGKKIPIKWENFIKPKVVFLVKVVVAKNTERQSGNLQVWGGQILRIFLTLGKKTHKIRTGGKKNYSETKTRYLLKTRTKQPQNFGTIVPWNSQIYKKHLISICTCCHDSIQSTSHFCLTKISSFQP